MVTTTDRNAVLITEASSGRGLGLAVRGSDAPVVATQPTFGAGERAIGQPSPKVGCTLQGLVVMGKAAASRATIKDILNVTLSAVT